MPTSLFVYLTVLAMLVAACGSAETDESTAATDAPATTVAGPSTTGEPSETTAPEEEMAALEGEVRIWTFLSPEGESPREVVLATRIEQFEAEHPGVTIVVESQPFSELESQFRLAAGQGNEPDLIWARDGYLARLYDAEVLANLDDYLSDEFKSEALPDMIPAFLSQAVFDGNRAALPIWPTPAQVIFYRQDLLAEAGLEEPPLNWDEFAQLVASLSDGDRYGLGLPMTDSGVSPFLLMLNGFEDQVIDNTGRFDLLGPESIRVAETIRALGATGALPPDAVTANGQEIQDQYAGGRFAFAMAFGPRFTAYQNIAAAYDPADLRVMGWPVFEGDGPAALMGPYWNIGMSATSQNPDATVAFLESLYTTEASLDWAIVAGQVPDRVSVLSDPYFESDAGATVAKFVEIMSAEGARTLPQRLDDLELLANVLNQVCQRLVSTDDSIEAILSDAQAELGW